jgi:hypothetical protein
MHIPETVKVPLRKKDDFNEALKLLRSASRKLGMRFFNEDLKESIDKIKAAGQKKKTGEGNRHPSHG